MIEKGVSEDALLCVPKKKWESMPARMVLAPRFESILVVS